MTIEFYIFWPFDWWKGITGKLSKEVWFYVKRCELIKTMFWKILSNQSSFDLLDKVIYFRFLLLCIKPILYLNLFCRENSHSIFCMFSFDKFNDFLFCKRFYFQLLVIDIFPTICFIKHIIFSLSIFWWFMVSPLPINDSVKTSVLPLLIVSWIILIFCRVVPIVLIYQQFSNFIYIEY